MPGTSSINGVISGLQTDQIIQQLIQLEQMPVNSLKLRQDNLKVQLTAWQDANTRILALKSKAEAVASTKNFDVKSFSSGDESLITGSAGSQAEAGTYYIKVLQLARSHQMKSEGYADTSTTKLGTGTITLTVGSGAPKHVQIDETNNTLAGLRDAINKSGAGVKAAIINDGSATNPYRLVVTSNTSGSDGEITISSDMTGDFAPAFSTMQAAQDAIVVMGEGEGAVTATRNSNSISDLIPGVTLNLQNADPDKVVTITTTEDTKAVKESIKEFVSQFNNLVEFLNAQYKYDETNKTSGILFSDPKLRTLQSDVMNKVFNPLTGIDQTIKLLSQVGITSTNKDNKLQIDDAALDRALMDDLDSVRNLFASVGESSNSAVTVIMSGSNSKPTDIDAEGNQIGYAVHITAVATQARVTAGVAQSDVLEQDETLTINGKNIELTAGMTAEQVVSRINEFSSQTKVKASLTNADGTGSGSFVTLTRTSYGSNGAVSVISDVSNQGTGASGFGTTLVTHEDASGESGTGTGAAGTDVAGTINGEEAVGSGQTLTGKAGNARTDGLVLSIAATEPGDYGTVTLTKGVAAQLADYLSYITLPGTGIAENAEKLINDQIKSLSDDIARAETRLEARKEYLSRKFAAMESTMGRLKGQGDYIMGMVSSWNASKK